jgi:hypothetical protein
MVPGVFAPPKLFDILLSSILVATLVYYDVVLYPETLLIDLFLEGLHHTIQ